MMKILIVTNMYPSEGDVSWRGSFVKEQVESYCKYNKSAELDIFHIKGKVSGGSNLNYLKLLPKLWFRLIFGGYNVVHCHHAFCVLLCIPWFYRLVYTVHEGELNNTSLRSILIKAAIHFSGRAIFVSRKEYTASGNKGKEFLPCGVNLGLFEPVKEKSEFRKLLGLPVDKKLIFFPADPKRKEKNANLVKKAEKIAIENNCLWHFVYGGWIPKEEMPKWMAVADIVVSVGEFESDGMVLKEAMACNTPVLSTDVGNAKYYIDDFSGLIVRPDPFSIYSGIKQILGDSDSFSLGRQRLVRLIQDMDSTSGALHEIYKRTGR